MNFKFILIFKKTKCAPTMEQRVLLEKLTGFQLVNKFPAFHGTKSSFTAFTSARHLSLT